jgi:hypothetical protein
MTSNNKLFFLFLQTIVKAAARVMSDCRSTALFARYPTGLHLLPSSHRCVDLLCAPADSRYYCLELTKHDMRANV